MKRALKKIIVIILCMVMAYTSVFHNAALAVNLSSGEMREIYPVNEPLQIEFPEGEPDLSVENNDKNKETEILYEDITKRKESVKEFVMSDKTRMLVIYPEAVHYEKDGKWEKIDNTLVTDLTAKSGGYKNKAGNLDVKLPSNFTAGSSEVSITKDDKVIRFSAKIGIEQNNSSIKNESIATNEPFMAASTSEPSLLESEQRELEKESFAGNISGTKIVDLESKTVSAEKMKQDEFHKEMGASKQDMMPEEINSGLRYKSVYPDVDIEYSLMGETLKENVIFNKKPAEGTIIRFPVAVENVSLVLNTDKSIWAVSKGKKTPEFVMPAPYMVDANGEICEEIEVSLEQTEAGYEIVYRPSKEWLYDEERAYPVKVDPVVMPEISSDNITDKQISSENDDKAYNSSTNQIGYSTARKESRVLLMYNQLPEILPTDVLVDAKIYMYLQDTNTENALQINVHKVDVEWNREITWAQHLENEHKKENEEEYKEYDKVVEDYATITGYEQYDGSDFYFWNITEIVRGWYESGKNTGMLFKCPNEVVDAGTINYKIFDSSDSLYGIKPILTITYLSGSGLESYWDYHTYDCKRAGTAYVNDYTGNLVLVNNALSTVGTRAALNINTVYNVNNHTSNKFSIAYGWRTNYNQLVYQMPNNTSYYIWEDEDGTLHYFYGSSGTYKDESGLELTLTTTGSGDKKYCLSDKNGNCSYFDANGRLKSIENNQEIKSTVTITYMGADDNRIQSVKDAVNRTCNFTYTSVETDGVTEYFLSAITLKSSSGVTIRRIAYEINLGNIYRITYPDGKYVNYSYAGHIMTRATDVARTDEEGTALTYKLQFGYTTLEDEVQNRVKRVVRYSGSTVCGVISMTYERNRTIFTDSQQNEEIKQFNNYGNTVTVQDDEGRAQYAVYATDTEAGGKNNQLLVASKLQNTVKNYIKNSSFELETDWRFFVTGSNNGWVGYSDSEKYLGLNSLYLTRTDNLGTILAQAPTESFIEVTEGETYTLSAYVKTTGMVGTGNGAQMQLELDGGSVVGVSKAINTNQDWQRIELSYTHPIGGGEASLKWQVQNSSPGTAYFDCVQIEKMPTASRYNLIENGDFTYFSTGTELYGWTKGDGCGSTEGRITVGGTKAVEHLDNRAYRIVGTSTNDKRCYQNIPISGEKDDVYTLAGWARASTVPMTISNRHFALMLRFYNIDGTTSEYRADFNPTTDINLNWQYAAKRIVAEKDYSSIRVLMVYDKCLQYVDFDGIQLFKEEFGNSYTYDENGNVTAVGDLQLKNTTYEYSNNDLTKATLPSDAELTYTYDDYHNVETATSGLGVVSQFEYDDYGNNTTVTLGGSDLKIETTAEYDDSTNNHVESTTDALGRVTTYTVDYDTGLISNVRAPGESASRRTEYTYDNMQRVTQVMKRASNLSGNISQVKVNYTYEGDLLSTLTHSNTSSKSTRYNFTYGRLDLISKITIGTDASQARTLTTYEYSAADNTYNLSRQNYGNGDYVRYEYDEKSRLIRTGYGDTSALVDYEYDNNGNLGTVDDGFTGRKTKYLYDFADRLMRTEQEGTNYSHILEWEYDVSNNLKKVKEELNGQSYVTEYEYDEDNRPISIVNSNMKANYAYDDLSRISRWSYLSGNTERVVYVPTYTAKDETHTSTQISSLEITSGSSYNKAVTYQYDDKGNIESVEFNGATTRYKYDDLSQLVREDNQAANKTWVYTYDGGGNITQKAEYAYTTAETLGTALNVITYGYGDSQWGDLLTSYDGATVTSDEIGNMLSDGEWTYTWTQGRRLATMMNGDALVTYDYNADGQRIIKATDDGLWEYTYNGSTLVHMTDGTNEIHFNYDANGVMGFTYNGYAYFYIKNAQGDVLAIINAGGTVIEEYTYDAWGKILNTTGDSAAATVNPFRYRSYFYDVETGLYYLNSRYYDPEIGRWINADGYISTGNGVLEKNMFAYCLNNPVNMVDPSGEIAITTLILIGSIVAGVAVSGYTAYTSHKYTGKVDWNNTILSGLSTFAFCYTYGMSAYGMYVSYCDYKGYTPVTNIGSAPKTNPAPYSNLQDPSNVAPGKDFTASQKAQIIQQNKINNNGVVKSDLSGKTLVPPQKSMKGVTPPANEWQIDHIIPKSAGGTNSFSNAQVLSREENRIKWDH